MSFSNVSDVLGEADSARHVDSISPPVEAMAAIPKNQFRSCLGIDVGICHLFGDGLVVCPKVKRSWEVLAGGVRQFWATERNLAMVSSVSSYEISSPEHSETCVSFDVNKRCRP